MKFVTPTNDPFARIGFAETYGELTDEYNYANAPKYDANFSNFNLWEMFSTKQSRERRSAETEKTKADTELNRAIAAELAKGGGGGGMSTGAKIGIGLGVIAMIGVTIWALRR